MIEELIKGFKEFIKRKGLKYTSEREEILQEILGSKGHFDVDELSQRLREKNRKISKASIYRSLPLFIEAGFIQEVYRQDGHSHYEVTLNKAPHLHFLCMRCGKVEEVSDRELENLIQQKQREKGFKLFSHHLESIGICKNCQKGEVTSLAQAEKGQIVEILEVPSDPLGQKLVAMGLRKGDNFKVLQICGRTMLIEKENTRLVINKELADKILVKILKTLPLLEEVSCPLTEKEEIVSLTKEEREGEKDRPFD